jgi:hypothetical protein
MRCIAPLMSALILVAALVEMRILVALALRLRLGHLLKGPEAEDHTLYASHTIWENRAVFEVRKAVGRSKAARKVIP